MAWTVIARLTRADGSTETRYARTFHDKMMAEFHLNAIASAWADPRVEIVLEEGGPLRYRVLPCLICGRDLEAHGKNIVCEICARWAVVVEAVANKRRAVKTGSCAVKMAVQQERRARL